MLILDTHALIWMDKNEASLGPKSRKAVLSCQDIAVSAISFWEVARLVRKGRLELGIAASVWRSDLLLSGLLELSVDGDIGIAAGNLSDFHGDPADRIIVATAIRWKAPLVTADERILGWPGRLERIHARD